MKITFISDTHGEEFDLSGGDLLIHCGDLTVHGFRSEVLKQLNYLHEQKDKYKEIIVIPGNHDFWTERHPQEFKKACASAGLISLIHEPVVLFNLKFWGSPATPFHHDWAFNYKIDEIKKIWETIPEDTDILLTHGPPYQILDNTFIGQNPHAGCLVLRDKVFSVRPQIHAFGHIHEQGGEIFKEKGITFINAAGAVVNIKI